MEDEAIIGAVWLLHLLLSMACLDVEVAFILTVFITLLRLAT